MVARWKVRAVNGRRRDGLLRQMEDSGADLHPSHFQNFLFTTTTTTPAFLVHHHIFDIDIYSTWSYVCV